MAFDAANSLQITLPNLESQNFKKSWNIDAAIMTLAALGLVRLHIGDTEPANEYYIWLDPPTDPTTGPGTVKLYNGSAWTSATYALFVRYIVRVALDAGYLVENGSDVLVDGDIGSTVQAYDADTLKSDVSATLTAGYDATEADLGTKTTGTVTLAAADGNFQKYGNNGAHTLAPPTTTCSIVVDITNGASAGTITVSGFTKVTGDSFTTTNGHKFRCYVTKNAVGSHLHKVAMQ